jgi:LAO/AO transport system kinase
MLNGDIGALARIFTMIENESHEVADVIRNIYPRLGKAYRIGITGPLGAGKSTLIDKLTMVMRRCDQTIGILCVDPSSPFSGGAVLGDRIRMRQHYLDDHIFIRSMSNRGSLGGLPRTVGNAIKLLDAFGKELILVETVGVGQAEVDIMKHVDTVVIVLMPEAGDSIQAIKAGLLECADIIVVNKSDRPGADAMMDSIRNMLIMAPSNDSWRIPIVATEALNEKGVSELYDSVQAHRKVMEHTNEILERRQSQRYFEFVETLKYKLTLSLWESAEKDKKLARYIAKVKSGEVDPYIAADNFMANFTAV